MTKQYLIANILRKPENKAERYFHRGGSSDNDEVQFKVRLRKENYHQYLNNPANHPRFFRDFVKQMGDFGVFVVEKPKIAKIPFEAMRMKRRRQIILP